MIAHDKLPQVHFVLMDEKYSVPHPLTYPTFLPHDSGTGTYLFQPKILLSQFRGQAISTIIPKQLISVI
jgi:hypothetical protein